MNIDSTCPEHTHTHTWLKVLKWSSLKMASRSSTSTQPEALSCSSTWSRSSGESQWESDDWTHTHTQWELELRLFLICLFFFKGTHNISTTSAFVMGHSEKKVCAFIHMTDLEDEYLGAIHTMSAGGKPYTNCKHKNFPDKKWRASNRITETT